MLIPKKELEELKNMNKYALMQSTDKIIDSHLELYTLLAENEKEIEGLKKEVDKFNTLKSKIIKLGNCRFVSRTELINAKHLDPIKNYKELLIEELLNTLQKMITITMKPSEDNKSMIISAKIMVIKQALADYDKAIGLSKEDSNGK